MATIAFLGLGRMGRPMARRVLDAGHDLTVWNRTSERAQPLVAAFCAEHGLSYCEATLAGSYAQALRHLNEVARSARTPAEAAREAEIVITMLADPPALEAVLLGPGGVAETIAPTACLVEMSTAGPKALPNSG